MSITSYAQNFEDVMLWRALGHIERGFYIDVGAQDPVVDSVSLAFHERGWRGVHIEPMPHYAELLRQQRPGDTVIQAAVGNGPAMLRFFEIPGGGLSTADTSLAAQHRERGFNVHETTVPCITLSAIFELCAVPDIHWLKIDVEGFEQQVLDSWGKSAARPWVVVVESTLPLTQIETHETWQAILVAHGYTAVYFDGVNRYYVSQAHPEIKGAFRAPPNVFDGFALNGTASASFHKLIEARYQEKISDTLAQAELQKHSANTEAERHAKSLAALDTAHAERERNWAAREQLLLEQMSQARQELETLLRTAAQREQEVAAQLLGMQKQGAQDKAELARSHGEQERALLDRHAEREQTLGNQLQTAQAELHRLLQEQAQRDREHGEQIGQARQELEALLRTVAQREQEVAAQLLRMQNQGAQEKAELTKSHGEQERAQQDRHAEREQALGNQLQTAQAELHRLLQEQAQRDREHGEQIGQARQELEALLRTVAQREQEVAAQLLRMQNQGAQEKAELTKSHGEQERALQRELATMRKSLSWRLTTPLRSIASWFWPRLPVNGHAGSVIEQVFDAAIPRSVLGAAMLATQDFTSNRTHAESMSMTTDYPKSAQATQARDTPNLKALLQYQDRAFVEAAYMTLLKRLPDPEGFNYYLIRLRAGVSKVQILDQIINSREGQTTGKQLPGLRDAVKLHKLARLPLVGAILKLFIAVEGNSALENRLRAVEQQAFLSANQFDARLERIGHAVNDLQQMIDRQSQQLLASVQQSLADIVPMTSMIKPTAESIQSGTSEDVSLRQALNHHDFVALKNDERTHQEDDHIVVGRTSFDTSEIFSSTLAAVKQWPLGKRAND